jgi:hypothetical protein
MRSFEKELSRFLAAYGLPPLTKNRPDGWTYFLHLYTRVIEDIPLTVSLPAAGKERARQGRLDGAPRHTSHVTVHFDRAREAIEENPGEREMLFKVTWTIYDKNGQSGDIFVINSFEVLTEVPTEGSFREATRRSSAGTSDWRPRGRRAISNAGRGPRSTPCSPPSSR